MKKIVMQFLSDMFRILKEKGILSKNWTHEKLCSVFGITSEKVHSDTKSDLKIIIENLAIALNTTNIVLQSISTESQSDINEVRRTQNMLIHCVDEIQEKLNAHISVKEEKISKKLGVINEPIIGQ